MKLEVGMYVRTEEGLIGKIIEIDDDYYTFDNCIYKSFGEYYDACSLEDIYITKASHNLLGNDKEPCLIEAGDYVNGYKVDFVQNNEIVYNYNHPRKANMFAKDIKSIVTKEQFESMSYKVG